MPPHKWDPVSPRPRGLVRPVRRDPKGERGPTKGQTAGPLWRRTSQGLYVPSRVDGAVPEQRILEQSARLPAGGAVTGWAACRMHRANFFDGLLPDGRTRIPVPLATGPDHHLRTDSAVTVSREPLDPREVVVLEGVPCTLEPRALFDEMRRVDDWREATVAMDMMAAAWLVSVRQMWDYWRAHSRWRRASQVARALPYASERSRSPNETRMRLVWEVDAGLPRPLVNQPVWDRRGRLLGIADLLDPVAGVVGEFDGADHRAARRQTSDVAREDRFRRHRLELFRVTGLDLRDRPLMVDRMTSARSRALWLPPAERAWTIQPPPGWQPDESLEEYRERRAWERELYARAEREGDPDIATMLAEVWSERTPIRP